jgi:DNA-binding transcriptional LysR family regulator
MVDTSLKGRKLAGDARVLCASPGYLAEHGTPTEPDDLHEHRLIAFRTMAERPLVGPDGARGIFDPQRSDCRIVVDDGLSQKIATLAGAGISANSLWLVHHELSDGSLVRVLPKHVIDDASVLWLVYPKSNILTAKVRVFIDFLLERIGRNPVWGRPF